MGVLATDDDMNDFTKQPIVVGKVSTLHPNWQPSPRQISASAVLKYNFRKLEAAKAKEKEPAAIEPTVSTSALCANCANRRRLGGSLYCTRCIRRKTRQSRRTSFLDIKLSFGDFLLLSVAAGLMLACLVEFLFNFAR